VTSVGPEVEDNEQPARLFAELCHVSPKVSTAEFPVTTMSDEGTSSATASIVPESNGAAWNTEVSGPEELSSAPTSGRPLTTRCVKRDCRFARRFGNRGQAPLLPRLTPHGPVGADAVSAATTEPGPDRIAMSQLRSGGCNDKWNI